MRSDLSLPLVNREIKTYCVIDVAKTRGQQTDAKTTWSNHEVDAIAKIPFKHRTSTQDGTSGCREGPKMSNRLSTADPESSQLRT